MGYIFKNRVSQTSWNLGDSGAQVLAVLETNHAFAVSLELPWVKGFTPWSFHEPQTVAAPERLRLPALSNITTQPSQIMPINASALILVVERKFCGACPGAWDACRLAVSSLRHPNETKAI